MSATEPPMPALGVGAILGETFALFFRRIGWFVPLTFVPLIVIYGVSFTIVGTTVFDPAATEDAVSGNGAVMLALVLQTVGFIVAMAFLVKAAYDAKLGRPPRPAEYATGALGRILPLVVCSLVVLVGVYAGAILLVVPGLWVLAVWSVVVPVIVIERAGIDALGRSAGLTKGYRWPIVGCTLLFAICTGVVSFAVSFVVSFVCSFLAGDALADVVALISQTAGAAAGFGIYYVGIALIYARLREIKEGVPIETLAEVFA